MILSRLVTVSIKMNRVKVNLTSEAEQKRPGTGSLLNSCSPDASFQEILRPQEPCNEKPKSREMQHIGALIIDSPQMTHPFESS